MDTRIEEVLNIGGEITIKAKKHTTFVQVRTIENEVYKANGNTMEVAIERCLDRWEKRTQDHKQERRQKERQRKQIMEEMFEDDEEDIDTVKQVFVDHKWELENKEEYSKPKWKEIIEP